MDETFEYDVFVSHSSKDKSVVRDIAERLRKDGLRVWLDEWELKPGDNIPAKIEDGLERSRTLVLCMSANAFGSDWAQLEYGFYRFRDPLNKQRRFIPLRLDAAPIKGSLAQFLYIDWMKREEEPSYTKLLEACRPPAAPAATENNVPGVNFAEGTVQLYAGDKMYAYAFSPDGKRVLVGGYDDAVRLWDVETARCVYKLDGHTDTVWSVAWSANQRRALSGSSDGTVRLWDVKTGRCLRVLEGHTKIVRSVALSPDQSRALSGADDGTVRLWDVNSGRCLRVLEGHANAVRNVALSPDQSRALSGADDGTVRLWDVNSGRCLRVLEGHTSSVRAVAWSADRRLVLSGSGDTTVRLWDVEAGRCLRVLEGHTRGVSSVAWSDNQRLALSGSDDHTIRLWDVESCRCLRVLKAHKIQLTSVQWSADQRRAFSGDEYGFICLWDLSDFTARALAPKIAAPIAAAVPRQIEYTNAKVLVVGESGAGKTGLTERLARNSFSASYSTSGAWATQWRLAAAPTDDKVDREIWLWDFGGQADQRLVHQLYLDHSALVLLVFNADQESVLGGLREWQQAIARVVPDHTPTYIVAGRTDVGQRFDREKVRAFAQAQKAKYFETSSNTGTGCTELREAIQTCIPWDKLERRTSPATYKRLKDEILKLRDEGMALATFKELREILRQRLAGEPAFTDADLETVSNLLDGPGVVKELGFGTYVLLRPEWVNIYAQAVIRTLRASQEGLGSLPLQDIARGKLIFQIKQSGGEVVDQQRLPAREEEVVLQAMEQMLLGRKLCLRQGENLVFPSYFGRERPVAPAWPDPFISYDFGGYLDDLYATLVVRLAYCGAFKLKDLWRDAVTFETIANDHAMGLLLHRAEDGHGILYVHFEHGVTPEEQVIFANYIHEHLSDKARDARRLRHYLCPHCQEPVMNKDLAMRKLEKDGKTASIICQNCEKTIELWDTLEEKFASESVRLAVAKLGEQQEITLDARRKGKLLALEVMSRITAADQKCFEIPGVEDEGIDIDLEFTHSDGTGSGKKLFLQLKAGNSHLKRRKKDGVEIFAITKQRWVKYWMAQNAPVWLVVGTFPDERDKLSGREKAAFADIRWMEISELLRRESENGTKPVKQIVFKGERLDVLSVRRQRDKALPAKAGKT